MMINERALTNCRFRVMIPHSRENLKLTISSINAYKLSCTGLFPPLFYGRRFYLLLEQGVRFGLSGKLCLLISFYTTLKENT